MWKSDVSGLHYLVPSFGDGEEVTCPQCRGMKVVSVDAPADRQETK